MIHGISDVTAETKLKKSQARGDTHGEQLTSVPLPSMLRTEDDELPYLTSVTVHSWH